MTKSELIARLAARNPHLYQRDVERIVATVFDEISRALASGHRVELRGFGAFSVKKRDPRTGRNPRTGEQVAVASKRVPYFKTGKDLRDRLNKEAARAAGLLPAGDIEAEAQAISWMSYVASTIHPAIRQGVAEARDLYAVADKRLGNRTWILGDRYSIADIHLFRVYWRFRDQLERKPGDFPALEAHHARMLERPAVKKTIEIEAKG